MKYTAKNYAQALLESLEGVHGKDHDTVLDNFVKVLAENNDMRLFEQISEEFHKLDLARKGIKQVEVTSAHTLTPTAEKEIVEQLNKLAHGKVEIKKKIDEQVLGGVLIQMDDQVLDATVKSELQQLKNELIKP